MFRPSARSAHLAAQWHQPAPRTPLPSPQRLTRRPHAPAPLPGGTRLSGLSSTSCPSRTRAAPQPRASFTRRSPDFTRRLPFKYRPEAPLAPQSIPSRSHRAEFAEICRIFNPPLQCVPSRASSLPSFGFGLRSRRSSPFVLSSFLCVANLGRTFLQSRRPPLAVVSSQRTSSAPSLALGEFASSA